MADFPTDLPVRVFEGADGTRLAWRELGEGRPVVLIHGYVSDAYTNWIRYGHAARIAATGRRVVMPDLRGHGDSARPHDPAAYSPDALADDGFALIAQLGLTDYDLGGYSLGARTTVRMLARGAAPRRAIVAGMGLQGLVDTGARGAFFARVFEAAGTHERGSPEWFAEAFMKTTGGDPVALRLILDTFVDTPAAEIARIALPVLVVGGVDDRDNGSIAALADLLPNGVHRSVPGNHMSAVTRAELGAAIADFLAEGA